MIVSRMYVFYNGVCSNSYIHTYIHTYIHDGAAKLDLKSCLRGHVGNRRERRAEHTYVLYVQIYLNKEQDDFGISFLS